MARCVLRSSLILFAFSASLIAGCAGCGSVQSVPRPDAATPTSSPYDSILKALQNAHERPVRILVLGDSRMVVDTTITPGAPGLTVTFGNRFVDLLRANLQARFGSHGTGIVPVFWQFGPSANLPNSDYWTASAVLGQECSLGPHVTLGSYCFYAAVPAGASLSFNSHDIPFDHLRAFCEQTPTSGTLQISIDNAPPETICSGTAPKPVVLIGTSQQVLLAIHSTLLSCAAGGNACLLGAVDGVAGTNGVSVDNFSIGSAALGAFASDPSTQFAVSDAVPEGHQLVIEAHHTNEPGRGETPAQFQTELNNLIVHERSLPAKPSIQLVRLLQDSVNPTAQALFYPIIASTAAANNTGFVDVTTGVGTGFYPAYFGPDGIHENNDGNRLNLTAISAPIF